MIYLSIEELNMKKKRIIIFAIILIIATTGFFYLKPKPETTIDQEWYTIENITFDQENNKISGTSTSPYEGEIEVYLPDGIDTSKLKDGQNVQVLAGPGMTMSLPPQLMNCQEIKIIE